MDAYQTENLADNLEEILSDDSDLDLQASTESNAALDMRSPDVEEDATFQSFEKLSDDVSEAWADESLDLSELIDLEKIEPNAELTEATPDTKSDLEEIQAVLSMKSPEDIDLEEMTDDLTEVDLSELSSEMEMAHEDEGLDEVEMTLDTDMTPDNDLAAIADMTDMDLAPELEELADLNDSSEISSSGDKLDLSAVDAAMAELELSSDSEAAAELELLVQSELMDDASTAEASPELDSENPFDLESLSMEVEEDVSSEPVQESDNPFDLVELEDVSAQDEMSVDPDPEDISASDEVAQNPFDIADTTDDALEPAVASELDLPIEMAADSEVLEEETLVSEIEEEEPASPELLLTDLAPEVESMTESPSQEMQAEDSVNPFELSGLVSEEVMPGDLSELEAPMELAAEEVAAEDRADELMTTSDLADLDVAEPEAQLSEDLKIEDAIAEPIEAASDELDDASLIAVLTQAETASKIEESQPEPMAMNVEEVSSSPQASEEVSDLDDQSLIAVLSQAEVASKIEETAPEPVAEEIVSDEMPVEDLADVAPEVLPQDSLILADIQKAEQFMLSDEPLESPEDVSSEQVVSLEQQLQDYQEQLEALQTQKNEEVAALNSELDLLRNEQQNAASVAETAIQSEEFETLQAENQELMTQLTNWEDRYNRLAQNLEEQTELANKRIDPEQHNNLYIQMQDYQKQAAALESEKEELAQSVESWKQMAEVRVDRREYEAVLSQMQRLKEKNARSIWSKIIDWIVGK